MSKTSLKLLGWNGFGQRFDDSAWSSVISAVRTMNTNGARNMIASAIRMLWSAIAISSRLRRTARGGRRRSAAGGGAAGCGLHAHLGPPRVVDPAPRAAQDHQGDGEGDEQQQHRHRRGVAHVEVAEPLLVEQHRIEEGRVLRIAQVVGGVAAPPPRLRGDRAGDVCLGEILQAPRSPPITTANRITGLIVGSVTHRSRCQLPAPSSSRRLVEVLGHVEHRRQEDDHRVADAPHAEQGQRRLRPVR